MSRFRPFVLFFLLGAAFFWLPDTLLHAFFNVFGPVQVFMVTIVSLISLTVGVLWLQMSHPDERLVVPIGAVCGIWLLAGVALGINGLFSGAGFAVPNGWTIAFTGMVPPVAYLMSSYDGTFFALVAATLGLLGYWVWMLFHI